MSALPANPDALVLALLPLSFVLTVLWAPPYIARLRARKLGKQIRIDGPPTHVAKAGTPTMGGWLMIATSVVVALIFLRNWAVVVPVVLAMLAFGLFGAIDDYANLESREGLGLRVRYKFIWHPGIALGLALVLYRVFGYQTVALPLWGRLQLGWWFVPLAAFVIFATTSGVNEVDGLDGLAGGTTALAFAAYLAIAWWNGNMELAAICAILIGTIVGFLWFNVHPATVFMGDTGSLALGAALAVVALQSGAVLLLPVIGAIFVVELLSVILQVAYFKATGGRRIFRMSPLHHHFELGGWNEVKIVQRFWLAGVLAAAAGVALAVL